MPHPFPAEVYYFEIVSFNQDYYYHPTPPAAARPRLIVLVETADISSSVEDSENAYGLDCRRRWQLWALRSTPMLWRLSQFQDTTTESEKFGD